MSEQITRRERRKVENSKRREGKVGGTALEQGALASAACESSDFSCHDDIGRSGMYVGPAAVASCYEVSAHPYDSCKRLDPSLWTIVVSLE